MADVISELLVRINAEDNASAVLGKVSSNVNNMSGTVSNAANVVNNVGNAVSRNKNKFESTGKSIKDFGFTEAAIEADNVMRDLKEGK